MYTYLTLDYLLDLSFDELLQKANLSRVDAAAYFDRTVRTIDNWRRSPPQGVCRQLIGMAGFLEVHGPEWTGWTISNGKLWTDSGVVVSPGEIRALPWLWAIRAEAMRKDTQQKTTVLPLRSARLIQS